MALTSTTTLDIINQTQTLNFFSGNTLDDQIVFSNNSITFETITTFNLSKTDLLLYFKYINAFYSLLIINFPGINSSVGNILPLCQYDLTISNIGVKKLIYTQNSLGVNVNTINYLPLAASASFSARYSPITITLQEFFLFILYLNQYSIQIDLN